ncbi:hypothetical protein AC579_9086 [Pseudocercospora musae]|uniref:Uncharacterized protein n=1 Tax=Pseudocercospora musae TaxID=113226 RepID=A0A139IF62_9PEZI|nr:hypothetical protein AC579_9086 [Pseudocercospora musae]
MLEIENDDVQSPQLVWEYSLTLEYRPIRNLYDQRPRSVLVTTIRLPVYQLHVSIERASAAAFHACKCSEQKKDRSSSALLNRNSRSGLVTLQQWVDLLIIPLEVEVLADLLLDSSLDRLKHIGKDTKVGGVVLIVVAALEDTRADQAGVPAVHVLGGTMSPDLGMWYRTYTSNDVRSWIVTDHVHVLWQLLLIVDLFHPAGNHLIGILVCCEFWLAIHDTLEVLTRESLVHGLDADSESTLRHSWVWVLSWAEQVTLREVDRDSLRDWVLSTRVQSSVLRLQQVHDDLDVGCVVAGVGEAHDGVDVGLGEVSWAGCGTLGVSEDSVWSDCWVPGYDVVWHNNVLKAVLLGNLSAAVALTTDNEDSVVVLSKSTHRCV